MKTNSSLLRPGALLVTFFCAVSHAVAVDALLLQDTYVDTAKASANYGGSGELRVFQSSKGSPIRSYLKFTTDTLPPGTTADDVKQARLQLWVNSATATTGSVTMTPIATAWDELTLNSSTAGALALGTPKVTELPINHTSQFISIDVTDWVKGWVGGTLPNEGFQIEASANSGSLNVYFDSKESTQTSHEPRLEIALATVGPQGATGPQGIQGLQGLPGDTGPIGPQGLTGAVGATGETGVQGPQGIAGTNGTIWFSWPGAPAQNLGAENDYYLDVDAGDIWRKALNAGDLTWSKVGNIRGPQGPQGETGATGAEGAPGPQGITGAQGPAGPQGFTGNPGPAGPAGDAGPAGPQGAAGVWPTRFQPQGDLSMGAFTHGPTP